MKLKKNDLPPVMQTMYKDLTIFKAEKKGSSTIVIMLSEPKETHVWRKSGKRWTMEGERVSDSVRREKREASKKARRQKEKKRESDLKGGLVC